ncbi:MAG: GMC family oxidoreductase, partial [Deltaproteobacteria bacterium]|nr:GMC family oxidoreductase [Deltaproteobacteria bacterium]
MEGPRSQTQFQAVVIGTGFGGSVTIQRLHQAGWSLCVLERGWEYRENFSRDTDPDSWLWQAGRCGMFDFQPGQEVDVVTAAGVGGGSLIYASVHLRAPALTLDSAPWKACGLSQLDLAPYYDRVESKIALKQVSQAVPFGQPLPPKTEHFRAAAEDLGRAAHCVDAPLAINLWADAASPLPACTYCGQCDMGCNVGAKNTLDKNYLKPFLQSAARSLAEVSAARPSCL